MYKFSVLLLCGIIALSGCVQRDLDKPRTVDELAELAGPDQDHNGIRDDLDAWIQEITQKQKLTAVQTRALQRYARQGQIMLTTDFARFTREKTKTYIDLELATNNCVGDSFGPQNDVAMQRLIYKKVFNTRARLLKTEELDRRANGMVFSIDNRDYCAWYDQNEIQ